MINIDFSLSDYSSLQKNLIEKFDFKETTYNHFEQKDNNQNTFYKRCFIESGFEVWVFSAQFKEDVIITQVKTSNLFYGTHFINCEGKLYSSAFLKDEQPLKGILLANGETNISFKIKALTNVSFVSFLFSKRWLDVNLLGTLYHSNMIDSRYILKQYQLNNSIKYLIDNLILQSQNININNLILKTSVFTILNHYFQVVLNEEPSFVVKVLTLSEVVKYTEEILSKDFEIPLREIYENVIKCGFNKKEFITAFQKRNKVNLIAFRENKKSQFGLKLLAEGYKTKEISKSLGYKSESKFYDFFKKEYGKTPKEYRTQP